MDDEFLPGRTISAQYHILWPSPLDTQDITSYTSPTKKKCLSTFQIQNIEGIKNKARRKDGRAEKGEDNR
jgi:hypothetical protein